MSVHPKKKKAKVCKKKAFETSIGLTLENKLNCLLFTQHPRTQTWEILREDKRNSSANKAALFCHATISTCKSKNQKHSSLPERHSIKFQLGLHIYNWFQRKPLEIPWTKF
jgi:hypothetical protein